MPREERQNKYTVKLGLEVLEEPSDKPFSCTNQCYHDLNYQEIIAVQEAVVGALLRLGYEQARELGFDVKIPK